MAWRVTGQASYSNQARKNTALANIQAVINNYPDATPFQGKFEPGLVEPDSLSLTFSFLFSDETPALDFANQVHSGIISNNRNYLSVNVYKVSD